MGEIDTKSMESVKVAVSLFEIATLKGGIRSSTGPLKTLSSYKDQLKAKDSERLELLHKLDHYHNTVDHLTSTLQQSRSIDQGELLSIQTELLALKDENREALERADSERGRAEEMEKQLKDARAEVGKVKGELESAKRKVGELRGRAEQAATRADAAEMELRKLRERKEKRKAAIAALREESLMSSGKLMVMMGYSNPESPDGSYQQPLGKFLNLNY